MTLTTTIPAPGYHPGVPEHIYRAWDAANQSLLWSMERSPAHCLYAKQHPKEATDEMKIGSLLHSALLEPATLDKYVIWDGPARNTGPGKEAWAEFQAFNAGRIIIDAKKEETFAKDFPRLRGMADAIRANPIAARYIEAPGESELSGIWRAPCGLLCKCRLDLLRTVEDRPTIVELKSTADARRFIFGKKIANFGWHFQAAAYCESHEVIRGETPDHVMIVVEQEPPHGVKVYVLNDQTMQTGRVMWERHTKRYAECLHTGAWPAYSPEAEVIDIPLYALAEEVCQ